MPEMPEVPFADITDLERHGRPTSTDEYERVETALADASQYLIDEMRASVARANPATLTAIVCAMVKRVLPDPDAALSGPPPGVESRQFGVGIFQESLKYTNPTGDMYLTKSERRRLRGTRRAFMVDTLPPNAGLL